MSRAPSVGPWHPDAFPPTPPTAAALQPSTTMGWLGQAHDTWAVRRRDGHGGAVPPFNRGVFSVTPGLMEPGPMDGEPQTSSPRWDFVLIGWDVIKPEASMAAAAWSHGVSYEAAECQFPIGAGLRDDLRGFASTGRWTTHVHRGAA